MLSDLNRGELREEGNLLIEAVSLLVQRQRETESWIADQIWQAEERSTATERRYAELEARLAGIEEHLARLVQDVEPLRDDAGVDERLERLREQVEGLKSSGDARTLRPTPLAESTDSAPSEVPGREPRYSAERRALDPRAGLEGRAAASGGSGRATVRDARPIARSPQAVGFWALLGPTPQDRFGLVLIGAGLVAVVYAFLSQLRF